jgi:glycine/serine hydroxymethyltransferase
MKEGEMRVIARSIAQVIDNHKDKATLENVKLEISELAEDFPIYPGLSAHVS